MAGWITYPRTAAEASSTKRLTDALSMARNGSLIVAHAMLRGLLQAPNLPFAIRERVLAELSAIERREADTRLQKLANKTAADWQNAARHPNNPNPPSPLGRSPSQLNKDFTWARAQTSSETPSLAMLGVLESTERQARFRLAQDDHTPADEKLASQSKKKGPSIQSSFTRAASLTQTRRELTKLKRDTAEAMGDATALNILVNWFGVSSLDLLPEPERATGKSGAALWSFPDGRFLYRAGSKNRMDFVAYCPRRDVCVVVEAKGQSSKPGSIQDPDAADGAIYQDDFAYVGMKATQMARPSPKAKDRAFVGKVGKTILGCLAQNKVIYLVLSTSAKSADDLKIMTLAAYDFGGVPIETEALRVRSSEREA